MFKKNCRKKNRQGRQKTNVKGQELGSEKMNMKWRKGRNKGEMQWRQEKNEHRDRKTRPSYGQ